jgi:hypothetical protein
MFVDAGLEFKAAEKLQVRLPRGSSAKPSEAQQSSNPETGG